MTRHEDSPAISVVIPCFNLGRYLDEAVDSVLCQTRRDLEVIVVDPGSTDESTRALLSGYRRPHTRVLPAERKRAGGARNLGISRARGRYICCLDADDMLEPECLEKTSRVLDADPAVGLVTFWYKIFGRSEGRVAHRSVSLVDFLAENCACTASLFRKEAWEKAGGYDEALEGYEDWDFWLRILESGYRAHLIEEFLFRYRDRTEGKHHASDSEERRAAIIRRIMERHESTFRAHALEVIARKDDLKGDYRRWWQYAESRLAGAQERIRELEALRARQEAEIASLRASVPLRLLRAVGEPSRRLAGLPYRAAVRLLPRGLKDAIPLPLVNAARVALAGGRGTRLFRQAQWEGPLVTVVIPCHNYGRFIDEALGSARGQTLERREVVVIDDGSTEPLTIDRLAAIEQCRHPGVRVIRQGNEGVCRARNNAIRDARGKYICCLDADDRLAPTYLEKCAAAMESEGLDICYSWVRFFGDASDTWGTEPFDAASLLTANRVPSAAVFTKAMWEKTGGYNPNMERGNEDWDFWLSIAGAGGRGKAIPELLFFYRRHGRGRDAAALRRQDALVEQMRRNHPALYAGNMPPRRPRLEALNPFINLALPSATANGGGVLLAVPGGLSSEQFDAALARARALMGGGGALHVIVTGEGGGGAAAEIELLGEQTPYLFRLQHFLSPRFHAPFLLDYMERRAISGAIIARGALGEFAAREAVKRFPRAVIVE